MSRKNFLQGAAILALAGVVVRIIGAIYRIPLTNILGDEGVGLYQLAYPVYGLLLTLSTAGVPGAISKMVSERMVHHDSRGALRVFRVSLVILTVVGFLSAVAMALGSAQISKLIALGKGPQAQPSMLAAAPALFFVAIITAYRGYFQGLQNMTPTAVSQVLEQLIKIVPGFFIAARLNKISVELGAAGAMWGVVLSEIVALGYLMIVYARKKRSLDVDQQEPMRAPAGHVPESFRAIASKLAGLALPMMAGAIFLPLASLADAAIVMNRLQGLGYSDSTALSLYGILSGMVNVLVNVPGVLSLSLSTSLIPAIAESCERKDMRSVERKSRVGLRITMLVSMPSAVGLAVLARPVMDLLYGHSGTMTPEKLTVGAGLLVTSSISVIFLSIVQSTNGSLQGLGRVYVPMVSLAIGAVIKIILNYTLVGIQSVTIFGTLVEVNIHGAPIGTIVCYLVPSIINLAYLARATGMRLDIAGMLIRPGLASLCMGLVAWLMWFALNGGIGSRWATVLAVLAAIPVYVVFAVLFGVLGRDELSYMPGGAKFSAFLARHKLLRG